MPAKKLLTAAKRALGRTDASSCSTSRSRQKGASAMVRHTVTADGGTSAKRRKRTASSASTHAEPSASAGVQPTLPVPPPASGIATYEEYAAWAMNQTMAEPCPVTLRSYQGQHIISPHPRRSK